MRVSKRKGTITLGVKDTRRWEDSGPDGFDFRRGVRTLARDLSRETGWACVRFFRSRVGDTVYQGPGGVYFVSSEPSEAAGRNSPRRYTVRQFCPDTGGITTVGPFNACSRGEAHGRARRLAWEGAK